MKNQKVTQSRFEREVKIMLGQDLPTDSAIQDPIALRRSAVYAVGQSGRNGNKNATVYLCKLLTSNDYDELRSDAAAELGEIGDFAAIPDLMRAAADEVEDVAIESLGALCKLFRSVKLSLEQLANSKKKNISKYALFVLEVFGVE